LNFDPAPVGFMTSATGGAAVAYQTNPLIGDDYEIIWEVRAAGCAKLICGGLRPTQQLFIG
jgi:hypothetical protein